MDHIRAFWREGTETEVSVGPVPTRKSIGLMIGRGSRVDVVAYFRNEEAAEKFIEALRELTRARPA